MKLRLALLVSTLLFLSSHSVAHAGLFQLPFGIGNSRPTCEQVNEFNPKAYTQSTVQEDCSNVGFPFVAEKLIPYYTVLSNPKIIAVIEKFGLNNFNTGLIDLSDNQTSADILGWGGLSEPPENRGQEQDKFEAANELYTRLRDGNSQPLSYANIGKNDTGRPLEYRLKDRVAYCKKLLPCLENPNSDLATLETGNFQQRCFEPQAYQITYQDGTQEVHYDDQVCAEALPVLEPYAPNYSQALKDLAFFTSSTDKDLLTRFLGMDPTPKRVELVIVCASANPSEPERQSQTAKSYQDIANRMDCQEFVVNATNVCDGVTRQAQAWMPYAQSQDYSKPYEPQTLGGVDGPWVKFNTADTAAAAIQNLDVSGATRIREYAKRINGEPSLQTVTTSERGGYINTDSDMMVASDPISFISGLNIFNPQATSKEQHAARTWYTLASPDFARCLEDISSDLFASQVSANQQVMKELRESKVGLRGQADLKNPMQYVDRSGCDYRRDPDGKIATDANGIPLIDESTCPRIHADYSQEGGFKDESELSGGETQKFWFLKGIFGFFTSINLPTNSRGVTCDFFGWLTGNPSPECTNEHYTGNLRAKPLSDENEDIQPHESNPTTCNERSAAALGAPAPSTNPPTVDYIIDYKNPADEVCIDHQELIDWVKQPHRFPQSLISQEKISQVVSTAESAGISPAFALSMWIEESGASDYCIKPDKLTYDFGAIVKGTAYNFDRQLNIFVNQIKTYQTSSAFDCREDPEVSFEDFMLFYSEGSCSNKAVTGRYFEANKNFPTRIQFIYQKIKEGC